MKKAFSTIITIILITLFSLLAIFILEIKSIKTSNNELFYLQSQSKLHLNFFKNYLNSFDFKSSCPSKISFNKKIYNLKAIIKCEEKEVLINIFLNANSKNHQINLHETLILQNNI